MQTTILKLGSFCGILAPILWALVIVVCGSLRPEYSHLTQYISELGERGGSTELIMRYAGFLPTGLMHIGFAASLWVVFKDAPLARIAALLLALNGLARIGAGLFPCEPGCALPRILLSQKLHSLSAGVGFFALAGSAMLWGIVLRRRQDFRVLGTYSIVSGCLGLAFLALMSWNAESRINTGLYERLSTGVLSAWVGVFAIRMWRNKDH
jgi:hypothetical membrane protein